MQEQEVIEPEHQEQAVTTEQDEQSITSLDEQKEVNKLQKKKGGTITLSDHEKAVEGFQTEIDTLKTQLADLEQYKPIEKSQTEIDLETKQSALFDKEIELELKAANLSEFREFFKVDSTEQLTEMIKSFQELLNKRKVPTGFIPNEHKSQDKYSQAKSNGNVKEMIKAKLFG